MITIMDVARARGAEADEDGAINGAEFERLGLPIFGGCARCGASIAAYNAAPTTTGYLMCASECADDVAFESVEAFEAWDG